MPSPIIWDQCDAEVKPIVSRLIEKFPEELGHVRPSKIGYLTFSKEQSKKEAFVMAVKPMYAIFVSLDYFMCIHLETWMGRTVSEKEVLIYHELLHIPEGGFDEGEKTYKKIVDHDVKDFEAVIRKFGVRWEDSVKIMKIKHKQISAEDEPESEDEDA